MSITHCQIDRSSDTCTPHEHESLSAFIEKVEASGEDKLHEALPEFEFWWADHCPNATQAEAWAEWCELHSVGDSFKFTPHTKYSPIYTQQQLDDAVAEALRRERTPLGLGHDFTPQVKRLMFTLSAAQRMDVMGSYCRYCGCDNPDCYCSRDD